MLIWLEGGELEWLWEASFWKFLHCHSREQGWSGGRARLHFQNGGRQLPSPSLLGLETFSFLSFTGVLHCDWGKKEKGKGELRGGGVHHDRCHACRTAQTWGVGSCSWGGEARRAVWMSLILALFAAASIMGAPSHPVWKHLLSLWKAYITICRNRNDGWKTSRVKRPGHSFDKCEH